MDTKELIDSLAADLQPVRRLPSPGRRLIMWLALSLPATALIAILMGIRSDLASKLDDPMFVAQQFASLATAIVAGWAALVAGVPGEPRWKLWLPILPFTLWMATLGTQCWNEWVRLGAGGMEFRPDFICIPNIALISALPVLAMVYAIRRGSRFQSGVALWWGSLAAAALANAGLRLFHSEDAALMVIVWQFGSVLLFTAIAVLLHRQLVPPLVLSGASS